MILSNSIVYLLKGAKDGSFLGQTLFPLVGGLLPLGKQSFIIHRAELVSSCRHAVLSGRTWADLAQTG